MSEQLACMVADLKPGSAMLAELTLENGADVPVAIVRADDGDFYAIDDMCTHGEVSLSDGDVEGCFVECWGHGSRFDVRTGEPDELPAITPVKTYPVRVDGERVLVDVDAPKNSQKENA
ncbi:non-heme iron oxygenase ferredoxin subunit [Demequina mangrovi]|uniref:3-phenylpropionate/trans-cinnamate dioxygenase ferredoxin subunit n=1 Tax=Demequina mangrovi TaxID=1043493 RepID=A0A1H7AW92_9MICO|nr:non-heme iron oxygenase ferredoxin subunit [Demequina mangrovi]SEJ69863.1 3-phenylpropionate/trans-cinnamate dioxygenase ferredoxin subunit [Demequina mangrovi]